MAEIVAAKSPQLTAALCFLWIWPYVFLFKNHAMVLVVRVVVWQWWIILVFPNSPGAVTQTG